MSTASTTSGRSLLVVDDDEVFRTRFVEALRSRGFYVRGAGSYEDALAHATEDSPEVAVVDLRLSGRSGLEVVRDLKALDDSTLVIVVTGYGSMETALESLRLGATHYLHKPVDVDQVLAAIDTRTR